MKTIHKFKCLLLMLSMCVTLCLIVSCEYNIPLDTDAGETTAETSKKSIEETITEQETAEETTQGSILETITEQETAEETTQESILETITELETTEETTQESISETITELETTEETTDEHVPDIKQLYFYSYTEYEKFIKMDVLPDSFVEYKDISVLGEFDGMVFLSDAVYKQDFSEYMYNLAVDEEYSFALYVYEKGNDYIPSSPPQSVSKVNISDLRTIDTDQKRAEYTDGDYKYFYIDGKLQSITWINSGMEFVLSSSKLQLSQYTLKENDAISSLLTSQYDDLAEIAVFKDTVEEK